MVKAKLYRQNHIQKHTHTHSQKEKKRKKKIYIYIIASKVHLLNLGCFIVYSGILQMQATSSWLWRFNPLLLRLLRDISLSLLCSHSSRGSALELDLLLRVGCLRTSVLCSDRMGLKEQLVQVLWLTQAGGREGYRCVASLQWQRPTWRCNSLRCTVCSPGEVVPGSWDPGIGGLHSLLGGELWIVTCACTQAFWWLQQHP